MCSRLTSTLSSSPFDRLDNYTILWIFELCQDADIENLYFVCNRFQEIIDTHILPKKCRNLLMTGTLSKSNNKRTQNKHLLTNLRRLRIKQNWINGKYEEHTFYRHSTMYPSYIHLEPDFFYMSHLAEIRVHRRHSRKLVDTDCHSTLRLQRLSGDVTCYQKHNQRIFVGSDDGYIYLYENDQLIASEWATQSLEQFHGVISVDFIDTGSVVVLASAAKEYLKIWREEEPYFNETSLSQLAEIPQQYKSIKISPDQRYLAGGKYFDLESRGLDLIDLETFAGTNLNSKTTSIYSLLWRDCHTLLTAHYDASFRLFDLRSDRDELVWADPYDSSLFSLDWDGLYGVVCGMNYHCRVNLYDLRTPGRFVQMYYPSMENHGPTWNRRRSGGGGGGGANGYVGSRSSPAYSIACDASQLFIATDHNLRILDFNADWAQQRDYRNIFRK